MNRKEAAEIYLNGLLLKNVEIEKFFEAARTLSSDDRATIQIAVEKYATKHKKIQRKNGRNLHVPSSYSEGGNINEYESKYSNICFG